MYKETLISYQVIDLSTIQVSALITREQARAVAGDIVQSIHNVPIELRGEAPSIFMIELFTQLRAVALEIIYRPNTSQQAILVWTTLGDEFLRSQDVLDPAKHWSNKDMHAFEQQWDNDPYKQIQIDLYEIWNAPDHERGAEDSQEKFWQFLKRVYSINPAKERVVITGAASIITLLYTYNWFLSGGAQHIEYNPQV